MDRLPTHGRLAGIDYGTVRIGVAICDPDQKFASPLEIFHRASTLQEAKWIDQLVQEQAIVGFVVGLPIHTNGRESQKSAEVREFATWLRNQSQCPVQLFDERYSTVEADAVLSTLGSTNKRRKQRRDMLAAQILLTAFLESSRETDERPIDS